MMTALRPGIVALFAASLAACGGGGYVKKDIEGNNTGGVIPPALAKAGNVQGLADAHCARWGTRARITFTQADTGGEVVFVCEPATAIAPAPAPPGTKQAPRKG